LVRKLFLAATRVNSLLSVEVEEAMLVRRRPGATPGGLRRGFSWSTSVHNTGQQEIKRGTSKLIIGWRLAGVAAGEFEQCTPWSRTRRSSATSPPVRCWSQEIWSGRVDLNHRAPGPESRGRKLQSLVGVAITSAVTPKILPQLVHSWSISVRKSRFSAKWAQDLE
jgi:hypothetical protein